MVARSARPVKLRQEWNGPGELLAGGHGARYLIWQCSETGPTGFSGKAAFGGCGLRMEVKLLGPCRAPCLREIFVAHDDAPVAFEIAEFDPARGHVFDEIDVTIPEFVDRYLPIRIPAGAVQRRMTHLAKYAALLLHGVEFDGVGQLGTILGAGKGDFHDITSREMPHCPVI